MEGIARGLRPYFSSVEELRSFAFGRSGRREIELRVVLAHDLKAPLPEPAWRR